MKKVKHIYIYSITAIALIACNKKQPLAPNRIEEKKCMPLYKLEMSSGTTFQYGDSTKYEYINDKVSRILYFTARNLFRQDSIFYDASDRLIELRRYSSTSSLVMKFTVEYNQSSLPQKVIRNNGISITELFPKYDSEGKLIMIDSQTFPFHRRYVYDKQGNVAEMYYLAFFSPTEVLARRNLKFDRYKRFWADSKELELIYTLFLFYEPSKNNVLETTVFYPTPSQIISPTINRYRYEYNSDSLPRVMSFNYSFGLGETTEPLYRNLGYLCQ